MYYFLDKMHIFALRRIYALAIWRFVCTGYRELIFSRYDCYVQYVIRKDFCDQNRREFVVVMVRVPNLISNLLASARVISVTQSVEIHPKSMRGVHPFPHCRNFFDSPFDSTRAEETRIPVRNNRISREIRLAFIVTTLTDLSFSSAEGGT